MYEWQWNWGYPKWPELNISCIDVCQRTLQAQEDVPIIEKRNIYVHISENDIPETVVNIQKQRFNTVHVDSEYDTIKEKSV